MNVPPITGAQALADALMQVPLDLDLARDDHRDEFFRLAATIVPFVNSHAVDVGEFADRFIARAETDQAAEAESLLREALAATGQSAAEYLPEPSLPDDDWSPPGEPRPKIRLTWFRNIKLSRTRRYLVKGLIPREGLTVVWGEPKCGKSFSVLDMMMHVARAIDYRGRRVQGGAVVYCAFEGQFGFSARVEAYRKFHNLSEDDVPLVLMDEKLDLVRSREELIAVVKAEFGSRVPVAVVLDTLNRSLIGSESSDEDMSAYVTAADAIRDAFHCAVIVVHHSGLDKSRPRGHTSLLGAADAQLSVKRDPAKNIIVECEYLKDGETGALEVSRLRVVDVGEDEDGEPITSCVVVPCEAASAPSAVRVNGAAARALDLLERAVLEVGEDPPAGETFPAGCKVVKESVWREYCYAGTIAKSDALDAKRKAFNRAIDTLLSIGAIGVWNDYVWIAGTSGT